MKISDALIISKDQLEKAGVSNSKLDSLILLSYALFFSKEQIIFNPDFELNLEQKNKFLSYVERRCKREPVSHIIGKREFYGRDFIVSKDVLDPRPDSESLIELVLKNFPKNEKLDILEIGCGSGCLIITLLKELQNSKGVALDISEKALAISKQNAELHEVKNEIEFLQSDVFSALKHDEILHCAQDDTLFCHHPERSEGSLDVELKKPKFDLIISNPPYIESKEIAELQPEVRIFEPRIALDGGVDGLDFYRRIAAKAQTFLTENGKIIIEIGFGQALQIKEIFAKNNFKFIESKFDLGGVERALMFSL